MNITQDKLEQFMIFTVAMYYHKTGEIWIKRYCHNELDFPFRQYEDIFISNLRNELPDNIDKNDIVVTSIINVGQLDSSVFALVYTLPCGSNKLYIGILPEVEVTTALHGLSKCVTFVNAITAYSEGRNLLEKIVAQIENEYSNEYSEDGVSLNILRITKLFFDKPVVLQQVRGVLQKYSLNLYDDHHHTYKSFPDLGDKIIGDESV